MKTYKPAVLIILDGWGWREEEKDNAIAQAHTPFWDSLWNEYPHAFLNASESHVGLPEGQMGNSEVGHMTIGAGKIIDTDLVRIGKTIANGEFGDNAIVKKLFDHVTKHSSTLHVLGLVSPGGVHSHQDHLFGLLRTAKNAGIKKIAIHAFTDGRDAPPQSAHEYLEQLEQVIESLGIGFIATATGRFYAMDRDKNWDRVKKAEQAIFHGEGKQAGGQRPSHAIRLLHQKGVLDEHMEPVIFLDDNGKSYQIAENDAVFFFNYRADRARQMTARILERTKEQNVLVATLTEYDPGFPVLTAFPKVKIETTLAAEISSAGLTQVHIAETEKYPHATYFLNGGREVPHEGEEHRMVESRKDVATHDLAPEMRAKEIADLALEYIEKGTDFLFINFANADMVGHTGNKPAIIRAVETVDRELGRVVQAVLKKNGAVFITADHGNAETNKDPRTGIMHTAHTTNIVPAVVTMQGCTLRSGGLSDVAPTVLYMLGLPKPSSMTGESLII